MRKVILIFAAAVLVASCATVKVTEEDIRTTAETLDYGDFTSETLTTKAWDALAAKEYPEVFAYTRKVVELFAEEGKKMNSELTRFEPQGAAAGKWALNDVGTSLFIMANAYEELEMYPEALSSYRTLAKDYSYAQCWDPKGWYWHPAEVARQKINKLAYLE